MRSLRVAGARTVHFKHERDSIKKDIAAALVSARVRARIYLGCGEPETVRELALRVLVTDLAPVGMQRVVLDSRGPDRDHLDKRVIRTALAASEAAMVTYQHLRSHEEPVLWAADAIAWCYGAGGDWRRRVQPAVEAVADVGPIGRQRTHRR